MPRTANIHSNHKTHIRTKHWRKFGSIYVTIYNLLSARTQPSSLIHIWIITTYNSKLNFLKLQVFKSGNETKLILLITYYSANAGTECELSPGSVFPSSSRGKIHDTTAETVHSTREVTLLQQTVKYMHDLCG